MAAAAAAVPAGASTGTSTGTPTGAPSHPPSSRVLAIVVMAVLAAAVALTAGCSLLAVPESPVAAAQVPPIEFDAASFWYQPIPADAAVDPSSDLYISEMADRYGDRLVLVAGEGSVTVFTSDQTTGRTTVPLTGGIWHGDSRVAGLSNVPLPPYAVPDPANDGHMAVVDSANQVQIDLWQARMIGGRWVATVAAVIGLDSDGVHRGDTVRASGFALTAGLIWPDELVDTIDHALVLGYAHTKRDAFVEPASWSDGWSDEEFALPIGAHLRLDPTLDLDDPSLGLAEFEKTIARAMQTYGMYIHDTNTVGSILELEAVNPLSFAADPYADIPGFRDRGYDDHGAVTLHGALVSHFEVLTLPPVQDAEEVDQTVEPAVRGYFYYRESP